MRKGITILVPKAVLYVGVGMVFLAIVISCVVCKSVQPDKGGSGLVNYFQKDDEGFVIEGVSLRLPGDEIWSSRSLQVDKVEVSSASFSGVNTGVCSSLQLQGFNIDLTGSEERLNSLGLSEAGGRFSSEELIGYVLPFGPQSELWQQYCGVDITSVYRVSVKDFDVSVSNSLLGFRKIKASVVKGSVLDKQLILTGMVTIESVKGSILRCSKCRWDFNRECFIVEGRFRLIEGELSRGGLNGNFDYDLMPVKGGEVRRGSRKV